MIQLKTIIKKRSLLASFFVLFFSGSLSSQCNNPAWFANESLVGDVVSQSGKDFRLISLGWGILGTEGIGVGLTNNETYYDRAHTANATGRNYSVTTSSFFTYIEITLLIPEFSIIPDAASGGNSGDLRKPFPNELNRFKIKKV